MPVSSLSEFKQIEDWLPDYADFVISLFSGKEELLSHIRKHYTVDEPPKEVPFYDVVLALSSVHSVVFPVNRAISCTLRPNGRLFVDIEKGDGESFGLLSRQYYFDAVLYDDERYVRCVFTQPANDAEEWRSVVKRRNIK